MSLFRFLCLLIYLPLNIQCGTDPAESDSSPLTQREATEETLSTDDEDDDINSGDSSAIPSPEGENIPTHDMSDDTAEELEELEELEEPEEIEIDGFALYADNCASCHNPIEMSSKQGKSASQIKNAILNIGSMNTLSSLSDEEIQAISDALSD